LNCDTYLNFEYRRHSKFIFEIIANSKLVRPWNYIVFFFIFQMKVGSSCSLKGYFNVSTSVVVLERLLYNQLRDYTWSGTICISCFVNEKRKVSIFSKVIQLGEEFKLRIKLSNIKLSCQEAEYFTLSNRKIRSAFFFPLNFWKHRPNDKFCLSLFYLTK